MGMRLELSASMVDFIIYRAVLRMDLAVANRRSGVEGLTGEVGVELGRWRDGKNDVNFSGHLCRRQSELEKLLCTFGLMMDSCLHSVTVFESEGLEKCYSRKCA